MYTIHIENIRTWSYHGCLPEESVIGGDYSTDVWIKLEDNHKIKNDKLGETVDYGMVTKIVAEEMMKPSKLIETVCERIIKRLFNSFETIKKTTVKVCKICPPIEGDVENISVLIKKER